MSSLLCMNIRGVRSFASDNEQRIEFFKPLTVIVGPNGCGKTSTIECLRYATTGALPPGSQSGRAFVHDPKVEGETEVKASVKLLFETADKTKRYMAIRNMQLTQKKKTSQFKQIDGVLRAFDRSANAKTPKSEITQKCAQLNEVLPALLGISRSVLDNVIFCHQEDSTWPLAEGSILKKRFDDIFESTRYTKALEEIIKQKKKYVLEGKEIQSSLKLSNEFHSQFLALESTKDDLQERLLQYSTNDKDQKRELSELQKECKEKQTHLKNVTRKKTEWEAKKTERNLKKKELDRHHANMEEEMDDSLDALHEARDKFDMQMKQKQKSLRKLTDDINEKNKILIQIEKKKVDKCTLRGEHQGAVQRSKEHSKEHALLRDQIIEQYGLPPLPSSSQSSSSSSSSSNSSSSLSSNSGDRLKTSKMVLHALQEESSKRKKTLKETERNNKKEYQMFQKSLTAASGQVQVTKSQTDTKKKEKSTFKQNIKNIRSNLQTNFQGTVHTNNKKTKDMENDVSNCEKKLIEYEKKQDMDEKRSEKTQLREQDRDLKKHEKAYREQQNVILKNQSAVQALADNKSKLNESATDLEKAVDELKDKYESTFSEEIDRPPPAQQQDNHDGDGEGGGEEDSDERATKELITFANNVVDAIEIKQTELSRQLQHKQKTTRTLLSKLNKEEAILSQKLAQQTSISAKVADHEKTMKKDLLQLVNIEWDDGTVDLSVDGMKEAQEQAEEALEDQKKLPGMIRAGIHMLSKWRAKVIKDSNEEGGDECHCQACGRAIEDEEEKDDVLKHLSNMEAKYELNLKKLDQEQLRSAEEDLSTFRQIKETLWQPWKIQSATLSKLAHQVSNLETSKEEAFQKHLKESQELQEMTDLNTQINLYRNECHTIENHVRNMKGFLKQIEKHRDSMPNQTQKKKSNNNNNNAGSELEKFENIPNIWNLETIDDEIDEIEKKRAEVADRLIELDRSLDEGMRKLKSLQDAVSSSRTQKQKHMERIQEQVKLNNQVEELDLKVTKLDEDVEENERNLKKLQKIEIGCRTDLNVKEDEHNNIIQELKKREMDCQTSLVQYKESHKQLEKFHQEGHIEKLEACDESIEKLEKDKREAGQYINKKSPELKNLERSNNQSATAFKSINDNILLHELQSEIDALDDNIGKRKEEYAGFDPKTTLTRLREVETFIQDISTEMAKSSGSKDELKRQLNDTTRELKDKKFKKIESKVRKLTITFKTTEMAVKDLEKYHGALDSALQSYHSIKVKEINMIIKEIWQICYKGGDVDMIELRSDPTKATATRARSYNYRVVMTKGNTELDMRGRCSAGQKQLASLVIRMALAETFCVNCGILALDEPTTNLDEENKHGLCEALSTIIDARKKQSNFQLIVITHDEDFVRMLGRAQGDHPPEFFYALSRVERPPGSGHYVSEIHKKNTAALNQDQ